MARNATPLTLTALLFGLLLAAGCGGKAKTDEAAALAPKAGVAVEVRTAGTSPILQGVEVTGTLAAKAQAEVKAEATGRVTEVLVTEWVPVKKGTRLALLDPADTQMAVRAAQSALDAAHASLAEAQTAAARADREKARMVKLCESGLATTQDAESVQTEAEACDARVRSAAARLKMSEEDLARAKNQLDKTVVVSPLDGVVAERMVNVGDLPGDKPLFRIVDNRVLDLTVNVPTSDISQVRTGQTLTFTTETLPGRTFEARVQEVNPSVNSSDRTVGVQARIANPSGELKSGLFVKGRIVTAAPRPAIQVPRTALSGWDLKAAAADLLVVEGTTARKRRVATGAVSGEFVEIVSGLNAGETYVLRGGFLVKDGDTVNPVPGKEG